MKKESLTVFTRIDVIILGIILIFALAFRLYKIDTPLADLHSWRQVDTAAVGRNFTRFGFDLMHPKYDDLSSLQSGKENPEGYRFVEFPIYNALFAATYSLFPSFPIEMHARIISIFFSLILIEILYYLCLKESNRITAIVTALTYAIFPAFVFFSRTVFAEIMATSCAFISLFFIYRYLKENQKNPLLIFNLILGIFFFAVALLVKPTAVFYGIALLYLFVSFYQIKSLKSWQMYIFFIVSAIPLLLWRYYIRAYPEGVPASSWLITSVNTYEGQKNIFFKPAFFRWIFFERINLNILGGYLSVPFILGIISKQKRYFLHSILLSALAYLLVFQGGNVQHEYYQILILPAIALAVGLGVNLLISYMEIFNSRLVLIATLVTIFILSFYFSYFRVKDYYSYPQDLVQIANIIKTLTKSEDKIVTDRLGDTTLLYLADRRGAPGVYKSIPELKNDNYKYLVTANKDLIKQMKTEYNERVLFENEQFTLFEL